DLPSREIDFRELLGRLDWIDQNGIRQIAEDTFPAEYAMSPQNRSNGLQRGFLIPAFTVLIASIVLSAVPARSKEPEPPAKEETPDATKFPRRLLYISVSSYLYLNPPTASHSGIDLSKPAAQQLAYYWQIPTDPKKNNQLFILSDTLTDP